MLVHVLACDYDGTIADAGVVPEATKAALARVRESGRKLVLVTGRRLDDLRGVCPDLDAMFDAVVAENGALLYMPAQREVKTLSDRPEPALVDALRRYGVPFDLGTSIIATDERFADRALAAIRETGVERTLVFNKGSMMLLPGGVTKASGLEAALAAMERSAHNTIGIGDAENDHAFLARCECAVAVADAIPALRERADWVTTAPGPRGVVELVEAHVLTDAVHILPALARHRVRLGERADGTPVTIPIHLTRLLVVGPSGSGKSTLTGVLVEQLVQSGREICLVDPEGDYRTLAELEGVVVLGGKGEQALPDADELAQLLPHPRTSLVLDLSALSRAETVGYATKALAAIAAVRTTSGMPHWLVVDEAHHIAPTDGSAADEWLRPGNESLCLITLSAGDLAPDVRALANCVVSTERDAFQAAVRGLRGQGPRAGPRGRRDRAHPRCGPGGLAPPGARGDPPPVHCLEPSGGSRTPPARPRAVPAPRAPHLSGRRAPALPHQHRRVGHRPPRGGLLLELAVGAGRAPPRDAADRLPGRPRQVRAGPRVPRGSARRGGGPLRGRAAARAQRPVVVAADEDQAQLARRLMVDAGAEDLDTARDRWWLGLRGAEAERYAAEGGDFTRDEARFRLGFEAALRLKSQGRTDDDVVEYPCSQYPDAYRDPAFRRGFERGRAYDQGMRRAA